MNIEFRKAVVPDEVPALCDFDKKAFQAYPADMFPPEEWERYESYWMIVEGKTVGCVALQTDDKHELWVASTAVLPEFRRQKFGEKLKE